MRKLLLAGLIAGAILAPGASFASHNDATCAHANNNETRQDVGGAAVVYADTQGRNGGMSRSADTVVGVCSVNSGAGGTIEAGHSSRYGKGGPTTDGVYVIGDGARGNPSPGDGYIGVSNYEKSSGVACPNDPHYNSPCSTNSGGEIGGAGVYAPGALLVCGDSSGAWDNTQRDGCELS